MKHKLIIIICLIICTFIVSEICLRKIWGFGLSPLYYSSNDYEYMTCPNQQGKRFGNYYYYNSYSQRCDEPDTTRKIILGLGDSVIYGGVQTDQDSLATSIISHETKYQMLNISAGSWGPDNCAAYIKKFGLFNACAMFLLVSSHDAHDNMDFQPVVGKHPSYPNKQYPLAWLEVIDRYLIPRLFNIKKSLDPDEKVAKGIVKKGKVFNPGFDELKQIADSANIPLIVYLHPEKIELDAHKYNKQGQEIISWAKKNNVILIKGLDYNFTENDYRDVIHINSKGQRKVAEIIKHIISQYNPK